MMVVFSPEDAVVVSSASSVVAVDVALASEVVVISAVTLTLATVTMSVICASEMPSIMARLVLYAAESNLDQISPLFV